MTPEDVFNALLDADPSDALTRLVFADWLQERGDPRAEGYRAMGVCIDYPERWRINRGDGDWAWRLDAFENGPRPVGYLPEAWYLKLKKGRTDQRITRTTTRTDRPARAYEEQIDTKRIYPTRKAAEDDAALAFAGLTADERAAVLATAEAAR